MNIQRVFGGFGFELARLCGEVLWKMDIAYIQNNVIKEYEYLYKNKSTTEKLLETLPNLKIENRKVLQDVILNLQSSTNNDVWQDFELRFNEVHSEFYEKRSRQFKELTPNEIRLCAFLKLNMTTKEISAITQQSARSIEVARVRKKLLITNTSINLVTFLNEL